MVEQVAHRRPYELAAMPPACGERGVRDAAALVRRSAGCVLQNGHLWSASAALLPAQRGSGFVLSVPTLWSSGWGVEPPAPTSGGAGSPTCPRFWCLVRSAAQPVSLAFTLGLLPCLGHHSVNFDGRGWLRRRRIHGPAAPHCAPAAARHHVPYRGRWPRVRTHPLIPTVRGP
jgi:hypothetical protein